MGAGMVQWSIICLPCRPPTNVARQFDSRTRRQMWIEFVVGSRPCAKRFFSGYSGFPLSPKTNTSKFQFDLESAPISGPKTRNFNKVFLFVFFLYRTSTQTEDGTEVKKKATIYSFSQLIRGKKNLIWVTRKEIRTTIFFGQPRSRNSLRKQPDVI